MGIKTRMESTNTRRQTNAAEIDEAPNFTAEPSQGTIKLHEWIGNGGPILFSPPKDFTRCAPRNGLYGRAAAGIGETPLPKIGLECGPVSSHSKWARTLKRSRVTGEVPMIGDRS